MLRIRESSGRVDGSWVSMSSDGGKAEKEFPELPILLCQRITECLSGLTKIKMAEELSVREKARHLSGCTGGLVWRGLSW